MIGNAGTAGKHQGGSKAFRVTMMFHPSHHVTDLAEAESWFDRVFGRPSTNIARSMREISPEEGLPAPREDYPSDYSTFTLISDVLFDSIDPKRYVLDGKQVYRTVEEPHLKSIGWYVDGMSEAYREFGRHHFRVTDQLGEIALGEEPPTAVGRPVPLYFSLPEETGLRYEFFPSIPFPLDPRVSPGWSLPPVSAEDPLLIERCSHHTVLTDQPERALRLVVDVLDAKVVHAGRNEVLGADSIYVRLADSILEYAVPDEGTSAYSDWMRHRPDDTYHSITWKVVDLERVLRHLESQGVGIQTQTEDMIVTEPRTSLGIPWGFTTRTIGQ